MTIPATEILNSFNQLNPYAKAAIVGGGIGLAAYSIKNPQFFASPLIGALVGVGTVYAKTMLSQPFLKFCDDLKLNDSQKKWAVIILDSALYSISTLALFILGVIGTSFLVTGLCIVAATSLYKAYNENLLPFLADQAVESSA